MSDLKGELEKRKARLALLRQQKAEAAAATTAGATSGHRNPQQSAAATSVATTETAEDILRELGIDPTPSAPVDPKLSASDTSPPSSSKLSPPPLDAPQAQAKPLKHLSVSRLTQTSVCQPAHYCKETQTLQQVCERDRDSRLSESHVDSPRFLSTLEWDDEFNHQMALSESELSVGDFPDVATAALAQLRSVNGLAAAATAVATSDGDVATATPPTPAPTPTTSTVALSDQQRHCRELSESERQQILLSDNFQAFFARASRVVERALAETEAEYFETDGEADAGSDAYDEGAVAGGSSVRVCRTFHDDKWSRGRCVTALDWSPHYQELCLAAYAESQQSHPGGDSDGVVCVWNARYRCDSPEFALHCQSPVTSACFATYQRCLIVGGTYSGQLVLWDTRTHRRTPVQRSTLGAQGHTEPCVFTRVLGTERANFLATLSSDARLCTWSLESLTQPVETCDLMLSAAGHSIRSLAATCLDMLDGNRFVAGTEDAMLCVGCRHGVRAGVMTSLAASHQAPVTSVAANPSPDLSHVVLSSSMDWTARVWSLREPAEQPLALEAAADYVMDARWSPAHPGLLCTADAAGRLDLWSLGSDPEQPLARCQPMGASGAGLNRCCFNRTGCVLTAGDHLGRVALLELSEALASPRPDEAQLVLRALHEARQARS
ncbi:hypothetical protein BOX15_Mlig000680g2 [Macrostomum lignano]|uniref:Uncharacterized protein n=2 Tax=Macrostomum lignano TaxID=282301 RepID=A0A267FWG3_9PLAT|nr:hypothetical protein BOX15_Mlig000680g2 [Macrostomum lignano]